LIQSARLVNSYQRVNPNAQRNPQKRDSKPKEEKADKLELTDDKAGTAIDPELELVQAPPEDPEGGRLDIAV